MSTVRLVDTPSFDEAALPLALVDLHGRVVRVNEALATFLARPAEQIVGRDLAEYPSSRCGVLPINPVCTRLTANPRLQPTRRRPPLVNMMPLRPPPRS